MSRSTITDRTIDLNSDNGAVLLSIVQGEQREFPTTITFLTDITGYIFKATVVEAVNTSTAARPSVVKTNGVVEDLEIMVPQHKGLWLSDQSYQYRDVVIHNDITYIRGAHAPSIEATIPSASDLWTTHVHNVVYLRFGDTFSADWLPQPSPEKATFGFFEVKVQEPLEALTYQQSYKPIRGLVEVVFSPTFLNGGG